MTATAIEARAPRHHGASAPGKAKALLIMFMAVIAGACVGGPDAAHYEAVLDELAIPPGWELVHTEVVTPETCSTLMGSCPRVHRYYLVDGEPIDALPDAKVTVTAAGFQIEQELGPRCDLSDRQACILGAVKESDFLQVILYDPGEDDGEVQGLAEEGRTLIRVIAQPK